MAKTAEETLRAARRRIAVERARALKLKNDTTQGLLVDKASVEREAFAAARINRESVMNVPARIAAVLAAETDTARVLTTLERELRQALDSASAGIVAP
jgi:hypothetical protein